MNDSDLLDVVKEGFGLKNDVELSIFLEVTSANISYVRNGKQGLGLIQKLKILDKISYLAVSNWVERVSPRGLGRIIKETNHAMINRKISLKPNASYEDDARLVVLAKEGLGFKRYEDLAHFLGMSKAAVSVIKSGRTSIGLIPRLKILECIDSDSANQVRTIISSTEALSHAIKEFAQNQNDQAASL